MLIQNQELHVDPMKEVISVDAHLCCIFLTCAMTQFFLLISVVFFSCLWRFYISYFVTITYFLLAAANYLDNILKLYNV